MDKLLSLKIGEQEVLAPDQIAKGTFDTQGINIIRNGITIAFIVAIVLAVFYMVWGGIKWIMSEGDKSKLDNARKTIIYAIVGLIVTFLAFLIVSLVGRLFGLDLLNIPTFGNVSCLPGRPC